MKQFNDFIDILHKIFKNDIKKGVISASVSNYRKITIEKKTDTFYITKYTDTQAFNENIKHNKIVEYIFNLYSNYKQFNFWSKDTHFSIKISKKNKIFFNCEKCDLCKDYSDNNTNNREKNYILNKGDIIPVLVDIGVMTKDGKIINNKYNKFRQINKFIETIDEQLKDKNITKLNVLDFGCGKSYLTFVLYHYLTNIKKIDTKIVGLDLKEKVIENCNNLAQKYNYKNLSFKVGNIFLYKPTEKIDMVVTLHACDIATDFALYNAIKWNTDYIFSVPCCQHEINKQISSNLFPIITNYGIMKERISAIFTDIIRCNLLTVKDYNVSLIEFATLEDTPKNLMIRAVKSNIPFSVKEKKLNEVKNLMKEFNFSQKLYELIYNFNDSLNTEGVNLKTFHS